MDKVNTDHSQLKDVPSMSMSDLFALVALVGMDRSKHQRLHKAYQELPGARRRHRCRQRGLFGKVRDI